MNPAAGESNPTGSPVADGQKKTWSVGTLTYTAGGLVVLFGLLLFGDFAFQLRERSATPVTAVMLRLYESSSLLSSILLVSLPSAMVMLLGPVFSYWSDHHRGRRGRRIPFLLWPTPLVLLSMVGMAFSPAIGREVHALLGGDPANVNTSILAVMALFILLFELVTVISNTLFNGLINDVVPRVMIGRFFGLFRAVSLGAGILFNYVIIDHAETHYAAIFCGIGILYSVGFTLMCLFVKEGEYPPAAPPPRNGNLLVQLLVTYWRECLLHPYYRLVVLFMACAATVFIPVNTFALFAARDWGMDLDAYGKVLVATYAASFLLAVPLGWLADRFHPLRVGITAMVSYSVVMGISYFLVHDASSFGVVLLLHGILSGCYFTGAAALGQVLFPRLRYAQFAAAAGLFAALLAMLAAPVLGQALDLLGNEYRNTFLWGGLLGLGTTLLGLRLHRRWEGLGGRLAYKAPE